MQDAFLEVWRAAGSYRAERGSVRTCVLVQKTHPQVLRFRAVLNEEASEVKLTVG